MFSDPDQIRFCNKEERLGKLKGTDHFSLFFDTPL